ncbi:hypothetical protein ACP70R_020598 [Stipagrostis hirtigluma subsp. patula]
MTTSSYLLLDLLLDIAARTDAPTLVRCAATCRDMRRHIADPAFHRRLRLRHADRFIPFLLRGHLFPSPRSDKELYLKDNAKRHAAMLLSAAAFSPPGPDGGEPSRRLKLMDARDGLLLVRTTDQMGDDEELRVYRPATGQSQIIPPGRKFFSRYVLLVGDGKDGGVLGRPFQVLKMNPVQSNRHPRLLQVQTFFSEKNAWGPYTEIPIPCVHGDWLKRKPLAAGGAVHWLCRSDTGYCVLKLYYVAGEARVTTTKLPASFHLAYSGLFSGLKRLLLATSSPAGGRLCVLVAGTEKISAWVQLKPDSPRWKGQTVIENEAMVRFAGVDMPSQAMMPSIHLEWFAERSGTVLVDARYGFFELDLQSKEIIRFHGRGTLPSDVKHQPYEMDLPSWVPTFTKTF